jgi:hypothetical protein
VFQQPKAIGDIQTVPAAFVPIRAIARTSATRQVIAESTTGVDGSFDFYLPDSTPADYVLETEASWTPPGSSTPMALVLGLSNGNVYRYATVAAVQEQTSAVGQLISIGVDENAGAFNILDKLRRGFSWVSGHFSAVDATKVRPVRSRWDIGRDTPDNQSTYYLNDNIYVDGLTDSRDEFDDPVVAHEFMHHVANCIVDDNAPGGEHQFHLPANPALAWNEGIATAFGQQALGYPIYWDQNNTWVAAINLEYRSQFSAYDNVHGVDVGTYKAKKLGGTMADNVSEILVAAVLWDLMDPMGDPLDSQDAFDATFPQTLGSIAGYLPSKTRSDRGASGIDLVDFLDGWRCRWPTLTYQDTKLHSLLDERQFPYDYPTSVKCQ